jgi:hypothetical protein
MSAMLYSLFLTARRLPILYAVIMLQGRTVTASFSHLFLQTVQAPALMFYLLFKIF